MIPESTEIRILPFYALEWERIEEPYAVISIMTTPDQIVRMYKNDKCMGVLRMNFPDLDKPIMGWIEEQLFSSKDAEQIWAFLEGLPEIETLIVHCEAGVSRSPAVGAAIAKVLGQDFQFSRYVPNPRVYRVMLETWNERHSAKESTALPPKELYTGSSLFLDDEPPLDIKVWRDISGS